MRFPPAAHLGREARDRRFVVDALERVDEDDAAGGHRVVRSRDRHHLRGAGHRTRLPRTARVPRVVAVVDAHAAAVGTGRPELLVEDGIAIHVVPASVEETSVRQERGRPFMRLMEGDGMRVLAVRPHAREREHRARTSSAPVIAAAPRRGEHDVPARQVDREEVVEAVRGEPSRRAARQRRLVDAVHVRHLHGHARVGTRLRPAAGIRAVMPGPHGRVREQYLRGVWRKFGIEETPRRQVGRRHLARAHR